MRTVWKYTLADHYDGSQNLAVPAGSKLRLVAGQTGHICLWFEVPGFGGADTDLTVWVVGTGWRLPDKATVHLGSVLSDGGQLVWHVYTDNPQILP